jgi:hypothetical protein
MQNRHIMFEVVLSLVCFALVQNTQALLPAPSPDGNYPGGNTAEGINALHDVNTAVGINNTAVGANALTNDTTGQYNVAVGSRALESNTTGDFNMAIGAEALKNNNANLNLAIGFRVLFMNTTGRHLTGIGAAALRNNTTASFNTAIGADALRENTIGELNTAVGANALVRNDTGSENNAFGTNALSSNVEGFFNNAHGRNALAANTGSENNAFGDLAMENNTSGSSNTAIGDDALRNNVDGNGNVAVGDEAGTGLGPSVNNCIAIGAPGDGPFATFDNTCFIGSIFGNPVSDPATQVPVYVDQFNNVGVFQSSSRRIKHDIQPMDKASETLYRLKPVTFKFNSDWKGTKQYGLIAEEVAEVDPQLVVHGKNGEVTAVHYEQINNMLLNEFLKEHKKVEEMQATVAQQQKGMEVLTAQLKEQAAQIQKVSAQLEVSKPAPQVVAKKR